jgi:uncharacterized protein YbjQ (UPF0145 family)
MIDPTLVTTNIELSGYRIIKTLGIVRGITVRSRSILGNIAGGFKRSLEEIFPFTRNSVKELGKMHFN